jgi:asparagine synthase (glutamine-hydrolysing)
LTDSLDNLLPDEIIHRPKMGFTLPWDHWMRDELKLLCEEGLEALSSLESMDSKQIMRIWNAFLEGDERWNFSRLWMLVALGIWMKRNGIS